MTTKTISGTYSSGYTLRLPATVLNITASGYVGGYGIIAKPTAGTDTVINYGTVIGYKNVHFQTGGVNCNGVVVNGSSLATHAYIEGEYFGVYADRVSNFGTITGAYHQVGGSGYGVNSAAYILNGSSSDTSALIDGKSGDGVSPGTARGTATRSTVINFGTISGTRYGVEDETVAQCQLTNGAANDTRAQIIGGISLLSAGSIVNFGTIIGSQGPADQGIGIGNGFEGVGAGPAMVTNGSAADTVALIDGVVGFSYGSLVNYGTINVTNSNTVAAAVEAYFANGVVTNLGTIEGSRADKDNGVTLSNGGTLTNGSASDHRAFVYGYVGVRANDAAVVTNFGTIEGAGGDSVEFSSAYATLIVEAGSRFIGKAVDDAGGGTLDLASGSGTITNAAGGGIVVSGDMPAATFSGFGTVDMASGTTFAVSGTLTAGAGQTFDVAGTLGGPGRFLLDGGAADIDAGGHLTVADVVIEAGSVNVGTTRLVYAGDWAQEAGVLSVAAGGAMMFTGPADRVSGTLTGAGMVYFSGGADALDSVTFDCKTQITGTAAVTLRGATTLVAGETVFITGASVLVSTSGVVLTGGGQLGLGAASTLEGASATATLLNEDALIFGGGALGGGRMALVNAASGTIEGTLATALTIDIGANTIANAGLIEAAGAGGVVIQSAIRNSGTLFADHGDLTVNGAVSGAGVVRIDAAMADFTGAFSQNVSFTGAGELELADSQVYGATITGFSRTGATSLDLGDIAFGASTTASFSGTTTAGVLTVTDGTHTAAIKLSGDYIGTTFGVSNNGHGGTTVVDGPKSPHAFIAAMAALGAAGGSTVTRADWTPPPTPLAVPTDAFR